MVAILKTDLIFLQIVLAMKRNNDYESRQLQAEYEKKKKNFFFSNMKMILVNKKKKRQNMKADESCT